MIGLFCKSPLFLLCSILLNIKNLFIKKTYEKNNLNIKYYSNFFIRNLNMYNNIDLNSKNNFIIENSSLNNEFKE